MAPGSVYGAADRAKLHGLDDTITAIPYADTLGTVIADKLRRELPDLDDLTIGRVLVALVSEQPHLFLEEVTSLHVTWAGLTAAALALTEPEWKEGTT